MLFSSQRSARITSLIAFSGLLMGASVPDASADDELNRFGSLVARGELDEALGCLPKPGESVPGAWALPITRLARDLEQAARDAEAAKLYFRGMRIAQSGTRADDLAEPSIDAAGSGEAENDMATAKVDAISLAAAYGLERLGRLAEAIEAVRPLLTRSDGPDSDRFVGAAKLVTQIGRDAMRAREFGLAEIAYGAAVLAANKLPAMDATQVRRGHAWASYLALENSDADDEALIAAADRLWHFARDHENHDDALACTQAAAVAYRRAGHETPEPLIRWLVNMAMKETDHVTRSTDDLDVSSIRLILVGDDNDLPPPRWAEIAERLALLDTAGIETAETLAAIHNDRPAAAEQLAFYLIGIHPVVKLQPAVLETLCRWASETERAERLSDAAVTWSIEDSRTNRTLATERLIAEILLTQDHRREALVWFNHLIDRRGDLRFETLLRSAELETAIGGDADAAADRIGAARAAIEENPIRRALVDLVEAEWLVRRARLDEARGQFEAITRMAALPLDLKGRAQWWIGETHYLQTNFSAAIAAYRLVDGVDPDGHWVAPSLIQAGKAFEQLGRTREAAFCYEILLERFGDSPHAATAAARIALVDPDAPNEAPSNGTMRR